MSYETDSHTTQPPRPAGIGSRATPPAMLTQMTRAAQWLATNGWVLRTGMAPGADQAFYRGAAAHGQLELYLPWPAFEAGACSQDAGPAQLLLGEPTTAAYELAARFHPAWDRLTPGARAMHARNCHQVFGADLTTPARLLLCWTPDGSLDGHGRRASGTGQALRIAHHHGIARPQPRSPRAYQTTLTPLHRRGALTPRAW
jgi:hypothetical protein